jgi:hypothetical protein
MMLAFVKSCLGRIHSGQGQSVALVSTHAHTSALSIMKNKGSARFQAHDFVFDLAEVKQYGINPAKINTFGMCLITIMVA